MNHATQLTGLTGWLDRLLAGFLALLMVALVGSVVWQVLSRYLFVVPAAWTEELARFLLIWIGMLGAAYAYSNGSHIGLSLLASKLSTHNAARLARFIHLMCLIFAVAALVIGGGSLVMMTWELRQYSAAMGLPIAVIYGVVPASGLLIAWYAVLGMLSPGEPEGSEIIPGEIS